MQDLNLTDGHTITWAIICLETKTIKSISPLCSYRVPPNLRYRLYLDKFLKKYQLTEVGCEPLIYGVRFYQKGSRSWTDCLIPITYGHLDWDEIEEEVENLKSIASKCAEDELPDFGKLPR